MSLLETLRKKVNISLEKGTIQTGRRNCHQALDNVLVTKKSQNYMTYYLAFTGQD